jgi:hypothetical protein
MQRTYNTFPTYCGAGDSQLVIHWGRVITGEIIRGVVDAEGYANAKYYRGNQQGKKK